MPICQEFFTVTLKGGHQRKFLIQSVCDPVNAIVRKCAGFRDQNKLRRALAVLDSFREFDYAPPVILRGDDGVLLYLCFPSGHAFNHSMFAYGILRAKGVIS